VRVGVIERFLGLLEGLVAGKLEQSLCDLATDAGGDDSGAGDGRVERHGHRLAGVGRVWSGDDDKSLGAPLAGLERLVPQPREPGQSRPRLFIGILGGVAQNDDDLVLHIETGIAVVEGLLSRRHHDPIAGKDDQAGHRPGVGERERLDLLATRPTALPGWMANLDRRSGIARAGGELER
jgi:hypothetical protein